LAVLKSFPYVFNCPYQTWNSNWEGILHDGMYMTDDEYLSNFHMDKAFILQLNRLVENDEDFSNCWGKRSK